MPESMLGCLGCLGFLLGGWIIWAIVDISKNNAQKRQSNVVAATEREWGTNDPAKIANLRTVIDRVRAISADRWTLTTYRRDPSGRDSRTLSARSDRGAQVVFTETLHHDRDSEHWTPIGINLEIDGVYIEHYYYFSDHESGARVIKSAFDHAMALIGPRLGAARQAADQARRDEDDRRRRNMMDRL